MPSVEIDLSEAVSDSREYAELVIVEKVLPLLIRELRIVWPRKTGQSAESWAAQGTTLVNNVYYTPYIQRKGRPPAMDDILQPLIDRVTAAYL